MTNTFERTQLIAGPNAMSIVERDQEHMSACNGRVYPLVIDHALGAEVWDSDGRRFIDWMAGIAVNSTGHCHPEVVGAIKQQADRFLHMCLSDFYYDIAVELVEMLDRIAPISGSTQTFLCNSGAEATEGALKLARYATGRQNFIAFIGAFHGRTMGALSLTGSKYRQKEHFYPLMPGVTHVPYPNPYRSALRTEGFADVGEAVLHHIEHAFETHLAPSSVAGIFIEPILGEGGYVIPPDSFLPQLRALCNRHGILLIADEVQTGIGRTGKWWAVDHVGVEPDIITTAKGLASGLPLGAITARADLHKWGPGAHGSTFGGNPLSCAAAVATLRLVENGMMANAATMGDYILRRSEELVARHAILNHPRGRGMMTGIDVHSPSPSINDHDLRDEVVNEAFNRGLLLLGAGDHALRIIPPLMIDQSLIDEGFAILELSLSAVEARL